MQVEGSTAVVTGAAGGIGAALAGRLLEAGARVVVTDLAAERLAGTVAGLEAEHPDVVALAGDAADEDHLRALVALAAERFGPVDLFFANAGIFGALGLDADDGAWQQSLEVNLLAHVRAARLLVPGWVERGSGYFVATASAAGLLTQIGCATYSASKHAALGFAEWLAITYGDAGVGVSCLCPMGVDTDMLRTGQQSRDPAEQASTRAVTGAGGVLSPLEVADAVLTAVAEERFLVLPHPEVAEFFRRKAADHDRWIAGMRRYRRSLG